jgi:hypothetical protein
VPLESRLETKVKSGGTAGSSTTDIYMATHWIRSWVTVFAISAPIRWTRVVRPLTLFWVISDFRGVPGCFICSLLRLVRLLLSVQFLENAYCLLPHRVCWMVSVLNLYVLLILVVNSTSCSISNTCTCKLNGWFHTPLAYSFLAFQTKLAFKLVVQGLLKMYYLEVRKNHAYCRFLHYKNDPINRL